MTITKINNTSFMFEFLQDELTYNTEDDLIYHILNIVATVEIAENDFYVGVQFHPEFKSRPNRPHPLFTGLIKASLGAK